jgi:putative acetyltransferase
VPATPPEELIVRDENPEDEFAIRRINEAAFERSDEADLIESLRSDGAVVCSLVAEIQKQLVAHILFSRMFIEDPAGPVPAVALAPVATLPRHQRCGIGGRLIREGVHRLADTGEQIVFVLGHPGYYSRFGFSAEKARSIASPFPPESFMAMELVPGALDSVRGPVRYPKAFGL